MAKKKNPYELKNNEDTRAVLQANRPGEKPYRKTGLYNQNNKEIEKRGVTYDVDNTLKSLATDAAKYQKQENRAVNRLSFDTADDIARKNRERSKNIMLQSQYLRQAMVHSDDLTKKDKSTMDKTLDSVRDNVNSYTRNFNNAARYYDQFSSKDDYDRKSTSWLNPSNSDTQQYRDTAMDRLKRYQANTRTAQNYQQNIDSLTKQLASVKETARQIQEYGKPLDGSTQDFAEVLKQQADIERQIKEQQGSLRSLNSEQKQYEDTQKTGDERTQIMQRVDFAENSKKRDYWNDDPHYGEPGYSKETDPDKFVNPSDVINNRVGTNNIEIPDKLGAFLSASTEDMSRANVETANGRYDPVWASIINEGSSNSWYNLTDEEKQIYYYKLNTEGQESAYKFLDDMQNELQARDTEKMQRDYDNSSLLEQVAFNAAAIPLGIVGGTVASVGGVKDLVTDREVHHDGAFYAAKNMSDIALSGMGQTINEATGNAQLPTGFKVGDAYSSIMSGGTSLVGATLFGKGYSAIMGLGAAASEAAELQESGANAVQTAMGAATAGIAEWLFERLSIENFLGITNVKTMGDVVKVAAKQAGIEASEEIMTEIANTLTNAVIMGNKSRIAETYYEEGAKGAFMDIVKNCINAGIGGALSGAVLGGLGGGAEKYGYNVSMRERGAELRRGGQESIDTINEQAANLNLSDETRAMLGDGISADDTDQRLGEVSEAIQEDVMSTATKEEIKEQLEKNGNQADDEFVQKVYDELNNTAEISLASPEVKMAADEMRNSKDFNKNIIERANEAFNNATEEPVEEMPAQEAQEPVQEPLSEEPAYNNAEQEERAEQPAEHPTESVAEERTEDISPKTEDEVVSEPVSEQATTEKIDTNNVSELATKFGLDEQAAKMLEMSYDPEVSSARGLSPAAYVDAMSTAYKYGNSGISEEVAMRYLADSNLTENQIRVGHRLGVMASTNTAATKHSENVKKFQNSGGHTAGSVMGHNVSMAVLKDKFNDTHNLAYKVLSTYAEATGIDIHLTASEADENGKFTGNQGSYNKNKQYIVLDINAGLTDVNSVDDLGKYAMLRTFSHEFMHACEDLAPNEYNDFRKAVFAELDRNGEDVNDLIEEKMMDNDDISYEQASREVIAEAVTDILPDSHFAESLQKKAPKAFELIRKKLSEFLDNIKKYFKSIGHNRSREANALKQEIDGELHYLQRIVDMYDNLAATAVSNYQNMHSKSKNEFEARMHAQEKGYTLEYNELARQGNMKQVDITPPDGHAYVINPVIIENDEDWNKVTEAIDSYETRETVANEPETVEKPAETVAREEKSDNGYTIKENPEKNGIEVRFDGVPSEAVRNALKENKFKWSRKQKMWYGRGEFDTIKAALDNAYASEKESAEVDDDSLPFAYEPETNESTDFAEAMESASEEERAEVREAMKEEMDNMSPALPTQISAEVESNENEDHEGTVLQSESDGEGTPRLVDERETTDVQGTGEERETVEPASERGEQTSRDGSGSDSGRTGSGSGEGDSESRVPGSTVESEKAEKEKQDEHLKEVVKEQVEQKSTVKPKGDNFVIGDSLDLPDGAKARFKNNVECIRILHALESEGRHATAEEQSVLSKYVGWGGISEAFGQYKYNFEHGQYEMMPMKNWENEFKELRSLVDDGIITEDDYKAMSKSTENAHYTSIEVVKAMYDGLEKLGFNGGRILEPSCGSGNFIGSIPSNMVNGIKSCTMVELDKVTGKIAKYLYPNYDVRNEGFQDSQIPDNYLDLAIGNVPFGTSNFIDRTYPDYITKSLHNYFFAKTLDKVRPGGICMYITSSFTMGAESPKVRKYFMDKADLIGAVKLPGTAFYGNANTQVVTDILVFKKRQPGTLYSGERFLESEGDLNEYFKAHPEMILGTLERGRGMYGSNTLLCKPFEDRGSLGDQIREALGNIEAKMEYPAVSTPEETNEIVRKNSKKAKKSSLKVNKDGSISQNIDGVEVKQELEEKEAKRVAGLISIRDTYNDLINSIKEGKTAAEIKKARKLLNDTYDNFVKKYGYINKSANKKAFETDPDCYSIYALETNYVRTNKKAGIKEHADKADIFFKDTIKPNRTITHVDSVDDGLIASINMTGVVDPKYIAKITGMSEDDVTRDLIEGKKAFKDKDGNLQTREQYLSGNVRAKLREAKALAINDPDYKNNIEELERVIPEDIPYDQIAVTVGSPWVPLDVYASFIQNTIGGSSYGKPPIVVDKNEKGDYTITLNDERAKNGSRNKQQWGTNALPFHKIMEKMLNNRPLRVRFKDTDGKYQNDMGSTTALQEKAEAINKEFTRWLWDDETRRNELSKLYNETFNAFVTPNYDGSNLTINGLSPKLTLRPHQANAVHRIIASGGNTLLAHKVGAGKTMEMAAAAMKLKELGVVKKPMFAVPKSLVAQWGNEFIDYFPAAKLLVADENSFTPANRRTFTNKIANGDYDAVIVSYEQFEKVPMSNEYLAEFYQKQKDDVLAAIAERKEGKMTVKQMQKTLDTIERKIAQLTTKSKDDDNITFESLGVDSLFVDEAHNFKNLQYNTHLSNIAGLGSPGGNQRTFDMLGKVRYLQRLNGGRGIVFATATPIMNSMAEMYTMQRYLQHDIMDQLGITSFDAWANQFGEIVNAMEIKPSGQGFRIKQSFSKFKNLSELQMLFRSFTDVLTDVPGLKIPKMKGGKVKIVESPIGKFQKDYMDQLEKRADNVKNVDPSEDNMLKITGDGRKISYTQRMIDPSLPYEPNCKIFKCCDNVLKEYNASTDNLGTQIIFCDMGIPKGQDKSKDLDSDVDDEVLEEDSAKIYDDIRNYLVEKGIPRKEIAFIHEANSDSKKEALFADVNDGKVRVLIGSTGKMGVGMNAQKRIVAIHHLDAPWRPGDVEQRDGRAFRQKNMNNYVSKYVYVTKGSFDARLWDILDRKQKFINQVMNGENVGRTVEDTGEVTLSAAEVKALASGNPLIEEQVKLQDELYRLSVLKSEHNSAAAKANVKRNEDIYAISNAKKMISAIENDISNRVDTYSDNTYSIDIGKKTYTDKKEAGIALVAAISKNANSDSFTKIGSFAGFDVMVMKDGADYRGVLKGEYSHPFNVYMSNASYMMNHLNSVASGMEDKVKKLNEALGSLNQDLKTQEAIINTPFEREQEYADKKARYDEIMSILNPSSEQQIVDDSDEEQYQPRTDTLTDREILQMAAENLNTKFMSDGEKHALDTFQKRLSILKDLEEQRKEQGRLYKDQQFGVGADRNAAKETLNRMHILDEKITKASDKLLSLEDKQVLKQVLHKSRNIIEKEERKHGKEKLDKWRQRSKESADIKKYRTRIEKDVTDLTKWVVSPDGKNDLKHVNDALKNSLISFLASIDFTSKRALKGGKLTNKDNEFINRMIRLRDAIKDHADVYDMYSGYSDLPPDFADTFQDVIDGAKELMDTGTDEFVINQMNSTELKKLSKVVKNLKKYIQYMNRFHNNAMFSHVSEAGNSSIEHLRGFGQAVKANEATNFLYWQQMRPAYAFERFGEGGKAIYDELRRAQATLAFNAQEIIDFTEQTYTDKEVKDWENEIKEVKIGDTKVKIPTSYLMGFYELTKQEDSMRHILGGGVRVATYKNGKEKISDLGRELTRNDVQNMVNALTDRQKEVADQLQKYMATRGAEWGNHVSVARFGEEMFTNENYYPINSDGRHLENMAEEHPSNAGLYALLNMSFTKTRNEEANNRIVLYSIFDVFSNHMASMAQYNAFALPVLDSIKWFNHKIIDVQTDDKGKVVSKTVLGSVREEMSRVYGVPEESKPGSGREGYAETFFKNIIRAFNGTETQGNPTDSIGFDSLHHYNMAQVAYNLRVVVQQPMAVLRALNIIDPGDLMKGVKFSEINKNVEEMKKYSGIAAWKSLGFYDINISRGLTSMIKHDTSTLEKIGEYGMIGAEKADEMTWATMWNASKEYVKRTTKMKPGTETFYEKTAEVFEDIIYKTQVVDSVLTKNEFMRSKGFFSKTISSFMSEPVTTASMVLDSVWKYKMDLQNGKSRQQAWLANKDNITRTMQVYAVSQIVLSAVQAVIDGFRDDDDKPYPDKWLDAFIGNVIDELLPFNKLPILSDFYDMAKQMLSIFEVDTYGNPPQSIFAQWYDALYNGTRRLYDKIVKGKPGYTYYGGIYKLIQAASGLTGLPMATATREVVTAWNNTAGALSSNLKVVSYRSKASEKYNEIGKPAGITEKVFSDFYEKKNELHGVDNDGDGRADPGTKQEKVVDYINSLDLSPDQKDALYLMEYKEKNLNKTPWH